MAELLQSAIQRWVIGGPDDPPKIMPQKKINPPPLAAKPREPEKIPGSQDITQAATIKDEKRRILGNTPKPTEKKFAGDMPGADGVIKKRVLGGAIGRQTTGE